MVKGRAGFTLVELLVTVGIIALLISALLPALSRARESASRTLCAARLRELVALTEVYLATHRAYPPPSFSTANGGNFPNALGLAQINGLGQLARWPAATAWSQMSDLPVGVVCPKRLELELFTSPVAEPDTVWWQTGYSYFGRVMENAGPGATITDAGLVPGARPKRRAVLWADTLQIIEDGQRPLGYSAFHVGGGVKFNQQLGTISDPSVIRGVHSAFTDGSVVWRNGRDIRLDAAGYKQASPYVQSMPGGLRLRYVF